VPRIGLFIEMQFGYGAGIVQGVAEFARRRPDWAIDLFDVPVSTLATEMARWTGEGVIATVANPEMLAVARKLSCPIVNVAGSLECEGVPTVRGDDVAIGRAAGEYLLERRFPRLLCAFNSASPAFRRRAEGFIRACTRAGRRPIELDIQAIGYDQMVREFRDLVPPVAAFCCDDRLATLAVRAARDGNLEIPDDVAILGAGNNTLLCELLHPTLSSVDGDLHRRGVDGAALLDRLLQGEPPPTKVIEVSPREVVPRQSTNAYAVSDTAIGQALRYIREHIGSPLRIEEIAAAAGISRRSLEARLRKAQGRSVQEEIWHQRVVEAKRLLRRRETSITEIAYACGFASASSLSVVFHRETGMTPRSFRATVAPRI
jgi:LacI family transcriptional regulator